MVDTFLRLADSWFPLVVILLAVLFVVRMIFRRTSSVDDGPLLASAGMLGSGDLQSMAQGTIEGFAYNLLTNDSGRVMFLIQLGHNSWSHIIAYGDKSQSFDIVLARVPKKWLEPAVLEGDFPDYFHLYCNPEAQDTVREIFTPDVMELFADFCRAYDFELFHDELYISQAQHAHDSGDTTTLTSDVADFLRRVQSELGRL